MSKLIIQNYSDADDAMVLRLVGKVISEGCVSRGQYCYVTCFTLVCGSVIDIHASKNKKSDKFTALNGGG